MILNGVMAVILRYFTEFGKHEFQTHNPTCDFLVVINTNLPPILHRFHVMADWSKFSLAIWGSSL